MTAEVMTENFSLGIHATAVTSAIPITNPACEYCLYFKEV